ncbi:MAG: sulfatase family protein [Planctomycetota bacterium]
MIGIPHRIKRLTAGAVALCCCFSAEQATAERESRQVRPNIVFFLADDISQEDFGCYGHPTIKTPNVDALAANGLRFDNAYLTTSSCSPSRCSIITGRYPHNTGAPELSQKLPESQTRFPGLLREAGYYTVLAGKNHMFSKKTKNARAFDQITRGGGPGSEGDWVDHVRNRPKEKPFFFWFASTDAHRSWQLSKDAPVYSRDEVIVPPYMVDTEITREDLASYYHEVSRFDHFIGLVRDELERQGVLDNTLIVVAADNGRPFPRCKTRLYDSGIKTPWVVHYPRVIQSPAVTESLVSSIDLSATCLELAGIAKPACIQGQSFLPILKNPQAEVRQMVFSEHNWHVYKNHERMVRFGDFVYIRNNYPNQPNLCYESDTKYPAGRELWQAHAAGKTTPEQQQVFANPCPEEELYQLSKDPNQFKNLAGNPEYAEKLKQARKWIGQWTKQTGDTIPTDPSPNRHTPPRIKNGEIIPAENKMPNGRYPHAEMPGAAANATAINHPGPVQLR